EDGPNIGSDLGLLFLPGDIALSILLEMKLAALPWHAAKNSLARRFQAGVSITDNEPHAAQASLNQTLQELPPVDFGFAQRDRDADNRAFAGAGQADGDEDSRIPNLTVLPDWHIGRIQVHVGLFSQPSLPPSPQALIQFGRGPTDLGRGDFVTTQLLGNRRHFAGRDP